MLHPHELDALLALMLGFALAGFFAAVLLTILQSSARIHLINHSIVVQVIMLPLLMLAGPMMIMLNVVRKYRNQKHKIHIVAMTTIFAGFWSIVVGVHALAVLRRMLES